MTANANGIGMRKPVRRFMILALGCAAALFSLTVGAITKEEYDADKTLIPTATADSPMYIVEPGVRSGIDSANVEIAGLDFSPVFQTCDFGFGTDLQTYLPGSVLIFR